MEVGVVPIKRQNMASRHRRILIKYFISTEYLVKMKDEKVGIQHQHRRNQPVILQRGRSFVGYLNNQNARDGSWSILSAEEKIPEGL